MLKILIAEDDRELRQLFSHVLIKNGYRVTGVANGQQALDALDTDYYDMIISDIMMPVMDGYTLVRMLRESGSTTPVLMITAKDAFDDMRLGFQSGVDDYMVECDSLTVLTEGETTVLPQKEFMLLYKMAAFPGRIFTRQQLMDEIWGYDSESDTHTVDVHIGRLRDRFRDSKDFKIVTIRGVGYKVVKL